MYVPGTKPGSVFPPPSAAPSRRSFDALLIVARVAALTALLIACYLAYATLFQGGRVAGCGGDEGGCASALASRWSSWIYLPVGIPAVVVYATALASTWFVGSPQTTVRRAAWAVLVACGILAGGAAIWFIGLQMLSVGSFCWYCIALHVCGLVLAGILAWRVPQLLPDKSVSARALLGGAALGSVGLLVLIIGQLLVVPAEPDMQVVTVGPKDGNSGEGVPVATDSREASRGSTEPDAIETAPSAQNPASAQQKTSQSILEKPDRAPQHPWPHRRLSILGGAASLDTYDYPVWGDRAAPYPVVEIFDYTCTHCRELFHMLHEVQPLYGTDLALVLLPVPMNTDCNPMIKVTHEKHRDACELARLAIAVWQTKPEVFLDYHTWLLEGAEPPSIEAANAEAARRVGAEALKTALANPAVEWQIQENCRTYGVARDTSRKGEIPKLLYGNTISNGKPASEEHLRLFLESQIGLKPIDR